MASRLGSDSPRASDGRNILQDAARRAPFLPEHLYWENYVTAYVHGYDTREQQRLQDQAATLVDLLHFDTVYPAGSHVLEVGCGVGAQTVTLARRSPEALITAIDVDQPSLLQAQRACRAAGLTNVQFQHTDLRTASHAARGSFDHAFICFVLEHLDDPVAALQAVAHLVRPGGSVTVIEGDHGSAFFHPDSRDAQRAIECQVQLQAMAGGDAHIGRRLFPLLRRAGLGSITVSPRVVYVDASRPTWVDGFTLNTFIAMIAGVRQQAIDTGLITRDLFDTGIDDLRRTAANDGTFCYTFFKATAIVQSR